MAEPLQRVVVDCETSGLNPDAQVVVEVAWWCLETGVRDRFVPPHDEFDMLCAEPKALELNGYYDRGLDNPNGWDRDGAALRAFHEVLAGRAWAGANPRFDLAFVRPLFIEAGLDPEPCHHRLLDIEATARVVFGWKDVPGMRDICTELGITPGDHTAAGDVASEGVALLELEARRALLVQQLPATAVVLDSALEVDHIRLTRAALRIPAGRVVSAQDRAFGRRALQVLAKEGTAR